VLGLVLLSAVTLGWQGVLTILLTGSLVLLTGSRTALYVFILGAVVLWSLRFIRQSNLRLMLFASLGLVLLLSAFVPARLSRMVTLTADGIGRPAIWQAALQESRDAPLGIGFEDGHLLVWNGAEQVTVDHAHNFWLEFLRRFGILGGVFSLLFSGALLWLGWRSRRGVGVLLVVAALLLNIFDYTLFYAGVFVPLLIGLGLSQLPSIRSCQSIS
jgi:O-antigen ligase